MRTHLSCSCKTLQNTGVSALKNITIVLKKPKHPGNVGSVARCAKNFGLEKISVVGSRNLALEEIKQMSTHCAADIVSDIRHFDGIDEALADFQYIVGTTARQGAARGPLVSPRELAERLIEVSRNNTVALLFGPEDRGLTNEDLRYCHAVVRIPTDAFKSLNLSHAVMILCYEIFVARATAPLPFTPVLATARELEGMYEQIRALLLKIGFFKPENPDYWMMHIRRFFARTLLTSREVKIVRGICRQLDWYKMHNNA